MIALVNMPFASITRASLAFGVMKAQLAAAGMAARVHNLSFDFARAIGFGGYEVVARFKGVETQVSEWLFAEAAWRRPFGPSEEEFLELCGDELETIPKVPRPAEWLRWIRRQVVGPYLERCCRWVMGDDPETRPRVVAFSAMFFQTVPALALGRLIKERYPEVKLAYGGSCFHGEAGDELCRKVPWIDAVATGEADDVVVPLFAALARGETPRDLAGILARDERGEVISGPPARPMPASVLEALPDPDFDEFFADADRVGLTAYTPGWKERVSLPFEASRGCWWGEKHHCTFCGLNGEDMAFRMRSAERTLSTLRSLTGRYRIKHLIGTDNILAMSYWKTLLPRLAREPLLSGESGQEPVEIFFEIKANLNRAQIKALADAAIVNVQAGIESLSTHVLSQFDKGVTGLQNVFLLKCCTEYGVVPFWNLLIRVPGETAEDVAQMESWMPLLTHLRPPSGGAPRVELHRYSPYFTRQERWIARRSPARWYRGIFPSDQIDIGRVAYYFDAEWKDTLEATAGGAVYDRLLVLTAEWMRRWREDPDPPRLTFRNVDGGAAVIEDMRGEPISWELDVRQASLYRAIDDAVTPARARDLLPPALREGLGVEEVRAELLRFVANGLALEEHDRFLGLALPPTSIAPVALRRVQMRRVANQRPSFKKERPPKLPILNL